MKTNNPYKYFTEYCFSHTVNLNDTFAYSCADLDHIGDYDLYRIMPLIDKYRSDAIVAYFSIKRGCNPIRELINKDFKICKEVMYKIADIDFLFMNFWDVSVDSFSYNPDKIPNDCDPEFTKKRKDILKEYMKRDSRDYQKEWDELKTKLENIFKEYDIPYGEIEEK